MASDEPLYLTVGTDVSAKYRGAFCEAKIKKVNRMVKCRVTFKNNHGTHVIPDDHIKGGTLRVGAHVEAKHPDKNQFFDAVVGKLLDYSQYTVVFDDGDETTLRRTSLCLKSGRHFAESEASAFMTLDQLPLTNPEHFGTPVMGSKFKRKRRSVLSAAAVMEDDSSEDEAPPTPTPPKKSGGGGRGERGGSSVGSATLTGGRHGNATAAAVAAASSSSPSLPDWSVGRVGCLDVGDKRKRDSWVPVLVVSPSATGGAGGQLGRDELLVRSFRDSKFFQVTKRELREFSRDSSARVESNALRSAVDRALAFLDQRVLPPNWDQQELLPRNRTPEASSPTAAAADEDEQDSQSDVSDDEPSEEKDRFVAQLYKFMDERGTPINKGPAMGGRDLNLYRLFRVVGKLGGCNRVTNHNQWRDVYRRLGLPAPTQANTNLLRGAYKKYVWRLDKHYEQKIAQRTNKGTKTGLLNMHKTYCCPYHHMNSTGSHLSLLQNTTPPPSKKHRCGFCHGPEVPWPISLNEPGRDERETFCCQYSNINKKTNWNLLITTRRGESRTFHYHSAANQIAALVDKNSDKRIAKKDNNSSRTAFPKPSVTTNCPAPRILSSSGAPLTSRRFPRYDEWVRKNRIVENVTDKTARRKRLQKVSPRRPPSWSSEPSSDTGSASKKGGVRRGRPPSVSGSRSQQECPFAGGLEPRRRSRRKSGTQSPPDGDDEDISGEDEAMSERSHASVKVGGVEHEQSDETEKGTSVTDSSEDVPPPSAASKSFHESEVVRVKEEVVEETERPECDDEDTDIDDGGSMALAFTPPPPPARSHRKRKRKSRLKDDEDGEEDGDESEEEEAESQLPVEEEAEPASHEAEELKVDEGTATAVADDEDSLLDEGSLVIFEEEESKKPEEKGDEIVEAPSEAAPPLEKEDKEEEEDLQKEAASPLAEPDHGSAEELAEDAIEDVLLLPPSLVAREGPERDALLAPENSLPASEFEVCKVEEEEEEEDEEEEAVPASPNMASVEPAVEKDADPAESGCRIEFVKEESESASTQDFFKVALLTSSDDGSSSNALRVVADEEVSSNEVAAEPVEFPSVGSEDAVLAAAEVEVGPPETAVESPAKKVVKKKFGRGGPKKFDGPEAKLKGRKKTKKEKRKMRKGLGKDGVSAEGALKKGRRRKFSTTRDDADSEDDGGIERTFAGKIKRDKRKAVAAPVATPIAIRPSPPSFHHDYLSTLAEVCGQEVEMKTTAGADLHAESADSLFLLCEEKVPASPPQRPTKMDIFTSVAEAALAGPSNADPSAPVLDNTPPTTPDGSGGADSSSPGVSPAPQRRDAAIAAFHETLDGESTMSADSEDNNSRGSADGPVSGFKRDEDDDSSSRTTDSASSGEPGRKEGGTKRRDREEEAGLLGHGKRAKKVARKGTMSGADDGARVRQHQAMASARSARGGSRFSFPSATCHRPSKFTFDHPLDEGLDAEKRISVLQDRLTELRKVYLSLKAEVAVIDRRRKRARKKESG
ncbi:unnamed protein product, partial [Ixodes pacificus]